jgi:peroxiredoxin
MTEAQAMENYDPERARKLYTELSGSDDPELSGAAKGALELMDMRTKPLDLKFTAVDGSEIDLAALRGQVVLVDFWATWCPPCVEEVPELVATYEKFKDQGFTIVGISLDEDKGALEKFMAENKMTWPQFFDGKGWENEMAKRFKIQTVPTMWLLDREGKLIDANPRERLEQAVAAALAAKN